LPMARSLGNARFNPRLPECGVMTDPPEGLASFGAGAAVGRQDAQRTVDRLTGDRLAVAEPDADPADGVTVGPQLVRQRYLVGDGACGLQSVRVPSWRPSHRGCGRGYRSRSNSATAAMTWNMDLPAVVVVSICWSSTTRSTRARPALRSCRSGCEWTGLPGPAGHHRTSPFSLSKATAFVQRAIA